MGLWGNSSTAAAAEAHGLDYCEVGTGPISAVSWYWVRILCSCTGFRAGCSLDKARQLICSRKKKEKRRKRKMRRN
ncbi:hypothetical protein EYF80_059818 [Liparis tanakae]|uniref:Uncharacterized protein n=1 Tax=Liparis tanakae TaxID=230148 RepID=A0A4Z2EN85_9TELE|nr:hypothetical protein EYF80_059818 [Liparis tanakae]